ncbi:MAG: hypothetical protein WDA09_07985 [Bacteriovoracaceae bacterium]
MDVIYKHWFDWLILISLLAGAFYTMRVIGQEKSSFRDESYIVTFGALKLMIPQWWSITEQTDNGLRFERTDTRYDWYAKFQFFANDPRPLTELLEELLNAQKIEFDEDVAYETDSRVLFRDSHVQKEFQEVIRVEGMASQDVEERIYYDVYLARQLNTDNYFLFESKSSVLNGSVEGPYFEESLSELELASPEENSH